MGMFGDLLGGLGDMWTGVQGRGDANSAKKAARDAKKEYYYDQEDQRNRLNKLDFQPAYTSDGIGPYKRTQSPAARAYLESLLTGDNPQAAASPWASGGQKAAAQNSFGQRYGSTEAMLAKGKADRASTPWDVTKPRDVDDSAVGVYRGRR